MKLPKFASTAPFAHLLGLAAAKADDDKDTAKKAEDEDDDNQRDDESDSDYAKRMEEKEDDEKAEDEDEDEDDKKKEDKAKKSKKADDDGDATSAAAAERNRCARIMAHGIANNCSRQAAIFAFDTSMSVDQSINAMKASSEDGSKRSTGLRERMSETVVANVGPDAGQSAKDPNDPKVQASAIILAGKKRRGEV